MPEHCSITAAFMLRRKARYAQPWAPCWADIVKGRVWDDGVKRGCPSLVVVLLPCALPQDVHVIVGNSDHAHLGLSALARAMAERNVVGSESWVWWSDGLMGQGH